MAGERNRITKWLSSEVGIEVEPASFRTVSGGCIHSAMLADQCDGGLVFVKSNHRDSLPMFEAEMKSLALLGESGAIRVPETFAVGTFGDLALFAMEGLELESPGARVSQALLGKQLADLHRTKSEDKTFGATFDNFIGATPQPNHPTANWADFFVGIRLQFQFHLAAKNGLQCKNQKLFLDSVHTHLSKSNIAPSLLHGDLWSGNVGFLPEGTPVIFDPATYFGDAEADIAFTKFFGGFSPEFYKSYREKNAEPEPIRHDIYNLYHILNHFNLFGGSYGNQAICTIDSILRETGG